MDLESLRYGKELPAARIPEAMYMYSQRNLAFSRRAKWVGRVSHYEDRLAKALEAHGIKFSRQQRIVLKRKHSGLAQAPHYVVDFLVSKKLIVEVDSYTHQIERRDWDKTRDQILKEMGYVVIRFTNDEIRTNLSDCVKRIIHARASSQLAHQS